MYSITMSEVYEETLSNHRKQKANARHNRKLQRAKSQLHLTIKYSVNVLTIADATKQKHAIENYLQWTCSLSASSTRNRLAAS